MGLVDTNAHLDMLEGDLEDHLEEARRAGLVQIAAVGIDLSSSREALAYARSCTSGNGVPSWKKMARGRVAAGWRSDRGIYSRQLVRVIFQTG